MEIKCTKEQKKRGMEIVLLVSEGRSVKIENEFEHKIALQLVEGGFAVVTKKKNYGRIAEIKGIA